MIPRRERWERAHDVEILPGTRLREILGTGHGFREQLPSSGDRTSRATGLVVSARSCDDRRDRGDRDAAGRRFVLGVQWHPESFWNRRGRLPGPVRGPRRAATPAVMLAIRLALALLSARRARRHRRRRRSSGSASFEERSRRPRRPRQAHPGRLLGRLVRLVPAARQDHLRGPRGRAQGRGLRGGQGQHRGQRQARSRSRSATTCSRCRRSLFLSPRRPPGPSPERLPGTRPVPPHARPGPRGRAEDHGAGKPRSRRTRTTRRPWPASGAHLYEQEFYEDSRELLSRSIALRPGRAARRAAGRPA